MLARWMVWKAWLAGVYMMLLPLVQSRHALPLLCSLGRNIHMAPQGIVR